MKKKILALAGVVLVAAGMAAGTLAYFTDRAEVKNTFTVGEVRIALKETALDGGETNGNTYRLIPGKQYQKDPTVSVSDSSEDCYLYVVENKGVKTEEYIRYESNLTQANGWSSFLDAGTQNTVYYRPVKKGDTAREFLLIADGITVNPEMGNAEMEGLQDSDLYLNYTAYAVQQETFTDAQDAWQKAFSAIL